MYGRRGEAGSRAPLVPRALWARSVQALLGLRSAVTVLVCRPRPGCYTNVTDVGRVLGALSLSQHHLVATEICDLCFLFSKTLPGKSGNVGLEKMF